MPGSVEKPQGTLDAIGEDETVESRVLRTPELYGCLSPSGTHQKCHLRNM